MHRTTPLILVLAMGIAACGSPERRPSEREPVRVSVVEARSEILAAAVSAVGGVEADARTTVGSKILGRVSEVHVEIGDPVRRGQRLVSLEGEEAEAAVAQAAAAIAVAEAELQRAAAHLKRVHGLHDRGSATEGQLDEAVAAEGGARGRLDRARAALRLARARRSETRVDAPFSGRVAQRLVDPGALVPPGTPLLVLEDVDPARIVVRLPESEIARIAVGSQATVAIEALGLERQAPVARVRPAGDPATRTYDVELELENPQGAVLSGMFARATFAGEPREVLRVPASALVRHGALTGLFVVVDGQALLRWIRSGTEDDGRVEVLSGLTPGERFVDDPPDALADGDPVEVRP